MIKELAISLNYLAASHILANPYAGDKGSELVEHANPMNYKEKLRKPRATMSLLQNLGVFKNNK